MCSRASSIYLSICMYSAIIVTTQYDEYKSPMDNIGMQDSLLSRFDIIFVVLDEMDPDNDRRISEHVLRMHRYRNPGEQVGGRVRK